MSTQIEADRIFTAAQQRHDAKLPPDCPEDYPDDVKARATRYVMKDPARLVEAFTESDKIEAHASWLYRNSQDFAQEAEERAKDAILAECERIELSDRYAAEISQWSEW